MQRNNRFVSHISFFLNLADVHVYDTNMNDMSMHSTNNSYNSYSNIPYTVSMPETPLPSDCDDNNRTPSYCIYDSDYDEFPSSRRTSLLSDTPLPRIIVTPTAEDDAARRKSITDYEAMSILANKLKRFESDLDLNESMPTQIQSKPIEPEYDDSIGDADDSHHLHNPFSDDDSADIIELIIDHDGNESEQCDTYNDYLSVIYEEDEHSHYRHNRLSSIHSSSSSITLANDDYEHSESKMIASGSDNETIDSDETETDNASESGDQSNDEDDQSTSVTVRLPLRLSFSRSVNNEEITTVMVGNSEIEIDDSKSKSFDSTSDVSVSFSLRKPKIGQQTSLEVSSFDQNGGNDEFDSDSEVSVSISLPMQNFSAHPKQFMRQQTLSPMPHDKHAFEYQPWNRSVDADYCSNDNEEAQGSYNANVRFEPNEYNYSKQNQFDFRKQNEPTAVEEIDEKGADDNYSDDKSKMSIKDRINAFNACSARKEELQRQNALQPNEEEQSTNVYYEKELTSTNEFNANNSEMFTPVENYCSSVQVIQQQNWLVVDDEEKSPTDAASLTIRDKIAAFEQSLPISNSHYTRINVRDDITATHKNTANEPVEVLKPIPIAPIKIENSEKIVPQLFEPLENRPKKSIERQTNISMERFSSKQHSHFDESEQDEDDSGVMDINRGALEETDTESECFPELRKLTRYERAATHSRLFKLLQEYDTESESENNEKKPDEEFSFFTRPKKIIHNVSITRKQNPDLIRHAETMAERRERLSLQHTSSSIDADNPSTSASPSCVSPAFSAVNEKLIDELVQSVLQQSKRRGLHNIPVDRIQSAARRALQQQQSQQYDEGNDSCDTFSSFDSTPALTPQEFKDCDSDMDILPSKAFKHLQEQSMYGQRRKLWAARCPRVLSSKAVNSDLSRVTETRESQTPEHDHY